MAIGKKCRSRANDGYGLGLVKSTSFGRKRVALSSVTTALQNGDSTPNTPSKRQRVDHGFVFSEEKSVLENLPQEILIRILCGVEHDDLKRLFCISKAIREATLIAKQNHFAYSTPRKTLGFQDERRFGGPDEPEAPNAPKQSRLSRPRLSPKRLSDISVALFASSDNECWPKRSLCLEVEMGKLK